MLPMVNFGVIVLKAKEPFVVWNNNLEEDGRKFSREEVNENPTAYIIPDMEAPGELESYLLRIPDNLLDLAEAKSRLFSLSKAT